MFEKFKKIPLILPIALSACAAGPTGPSYMALPGTGKSFDQFRADDTACRQFAQASIGGSTANQAANASLVGSAVVGTAVGAAVGAVAGGGRGAGVGAATGLVAGSLIGSDQASMSSYQTQHRYDNAYLQCMYASGDRIPVSGRLLRAPPIYNIPPPAAYPPPPGYMPPVPPNAVQ